MAVGDTPALPGLIEGARFAHAIFDGHAARRRAARTAAGIRPQRKDTHHLHPAAESCFKSSSTTAACQSRHMFRPRMRCPIIGTPPQNFPCSVNIFFFHHLPFTLSPCLFENLFWTMGERRSPLHRLLFTLSLCLFENLFGRWANAVRYGLYVLVLSSSFILHPSYFKAPLRHHPDPFNGLLTGAFGHFIRNAQHQPRMEISHHLLHASHQILT